MNKRVKNRTEREDKMIQAAMMVFDQHGIETTKMTDIASQAAIGVASLYRYFSNKVELALTVGMAYWDDLYDYIDNIQTQNLTGIEGLKQMMKVYTDDHIKLTAFFRFIEQLDAFLMKVKGSEERLKQYENKLNAIEPFFDHLLERGIKDGTIRNDIDIQKTYVMISHTITALKQKHCSRGFVISSDSKELLKEEIEFVIQVFMAYLEP